jgi:alpha-N-acetylglucosaminidase
MKNRYFYSVLVAVVVLALGSSSLKADVSLNGLVKRILPGHENKFKFEKIPPAADGKNVYELESSGDKIIIRGDNANSMARGLGTYLRKYCHISVTWDVKNPLPVPEKFPVIKKKQRVTCSVKNRFFFNYCTFGYTMPFWQWKDWERCIDWMALNGINAPLAITGTEKVLVELWTSQGFSKEQVLEFFTDAAHLPWYHMNTISHWGGPCPESYVEHGYKLQKKILARERELGMRPIMMAFNGRVPVALQKKYPNKPIHVLGKGWGMFKKPYYTYFLDPYDPLFAELQKKYLEINIKLYGTDHLYGVDPFNEIEPPSWEPSYLGKTAKRIYETISDVDKDAVWIQMGWLFGFDKHWTNPRIKALLKAVPQDKLVILDYNCSTTGIWERTEAFFDTPFVYCYLGNFGGKECLAGALPAIYEGFSKVVKERGGKNLWGIGSTLEGFGVNMVTFEYLFDNPWSDMEPDVQKWIAEYAKSRIAGNDKPVIDAWKMMQSKIYNRNSSGYSGGSPLHVRPRFEGGCGFVIMGRNFTPSTLMAIWKLMMKASPETVKKDSFQYDLVNVVRQYLGDISTSVRAEMRDAYMTGDLEKFQKAANTMMGLLKDQEEIVRSRPEFLVGRWFAGAKAIATNDKDKEAMEWSIRNILTTWGGRSCPLVEYANRDWDGLTSDYYNKRWKMFTEDVAAAMKKGKEFNQGVFDGKSATFEWEYVNDKTKNNYIAEPTGNSWDIAKRLFEKYSNLKIEDLKSASTKVNVAKWTGDMLSREYKTHTWDISKYVNQKGLCIITLDYTSGAHAIDMKNVILKCNGVAIGEDNHIGRTGSNDTNNVYKFIIKELIPAAKYELQVDIMASVKASVKKIDSKGNVIMEIFPKFNASSLKRAPVSAKVGSWEKSMLANSYKSVDWDITNSLKKPGTYKFTFKYTGGNHALGMKDVKIKCNGEVVAEDNHSGSTGTVNNQNVFTLKVSNITAGAKYKLSADIKAITPNTTVTPNSCGDIIVEYVTEDK